MGVKNLWSVLEETCDKDVPVKSLYGKRVAVDLSSWIVEFRQSKGSESFKTLYLRNLFLRTTELLGYGIKLIFVADGRAPHMKAAVMRKRQEAQFGKSSKEGETTDTSRQWFHTIIEKCKELLRCLGVPFLYSDGEGEALCAVLSAAELVDGVVTSDVDALLYGASTVYRNYRKDSRGVCAVDVYSMKTIEDKLALNQRCLVVVALLSGCDYADAGVDSIGAKKALTLIKDIQELGLDPLDRLCSWPTNTDLDDLSKGAEKPNHCRNCGHTGERASHKSAGCSYCGTVMSCITTPTKPGTTPTKPGTTPTKPGTTPTKPGTTPTKPGTTPTNSGTTPTKPGTTPTKSGTTPTKPGTTPTIPGTTPTKSGTTPTKPGTTPTIAGTTPTKSGTTPTKPGTTPTIAGTTPTKPGTTPTIPETTPTKSGTTPTKPGTTPTIRDPSATSPPPTKPCQCLWHRRKDHVLELRTRERALMDKTFPSHEIIEEYLGASKLLKSPDLSFHPICVADLKTYIRGHFLSRQTEFYSMIAPILVQLRLHNMTDCLTAATTLNPLTIVRTCRRQHVPCVDVHWSKLSEDQETTSGYYSVTSEMEIFKEKFPDMVQEFLEKKSQGGKKRKAETSHPSSQSSPQKKINQFFKSVKRS